MHDSSQYRLDVLIYIVVATFIIAGTYVGYQYSLDPANFEAHDITMPGVNLESTNTMIQEYDTESAHDNNHHALYVVGRII